MQPSFCTLARTARSTQPGLAECAERLNNNNGFVRNGIDTLLILETRVEHS